MVVYGGFIMKKLVVCDVDGTLLPRGEDKISDEVLAAIRSLENKNIVFAAASGRQYSELFDIFRGHGDMYYICADGGAVIYRGEVLYKKPIPDFAVRSVFEKSKLVFHTPFKTYYRDLALGAVMAARYKDYAVHSCDLSEVHDVIKISKLGAEYSEAPPCTFEVYKSSEWTDWISVGAGKGAAVEYMQRRLKVGFRETAVFGDNLNDLSMLRRAANKYIMKDAVHRMNLPGAVIVEDIARALEEI